MNALQKLLKSYLNKKKYGFNVKGVGEFWLKRADGSEEYWKHDNIITDDGFDFISDVIAHPTQPANMDNIAVGTGVTAADAADSALETEIERNAATYDHIAGTKVFTLEATFSPGEATGAITEAGVLNAGAGGILLDRIVFPLKNKGAGDTITIRFTFTLS